MVVSLRQRPVALPRPSSFSCPLCHEGRNEVRDSRPWHGMIRRRRRCSSCAHTFTTIEVTEPVYNGLNLLPLARTTTDAMNELIRHYNVLHRAIKQARARTEEQDT